MSSREHRQLLQQKSREMKGVSNGIAITRHDSLQPKGHTMPNTKNESESENMNSEKGNQKLAVLSEPKEIIVEETSRSMSLIDDTVKHLGGLMKGLTTNSPSP